LHSVASFAFHGSAAELIEEVEQDVDVRGRWLRFIAGHHNSKAPAIGCQVYDSRYIWDALAGRYLSVAPSCGLVRLEEAVLRGIGRDHDSAVAGHIEQVATFGRPNRRRPPFG
jgi:hypothetical protein